MNLLGIIQRACATIGISPPDSVMSNPDEQVQQLLWLAQAAGDDLAEAHDWSSLVVMRDFTPVAQVAQNEPPIASIPFARFAPAASLWDVNMRRPLYGPLNRDDWMALLTTTISGIDKYWTMLDGKMNIFPAPAVTDLFRYTYVTKNWIRHAGGDRTTDTDEWNADNNEPLVPGQLLVLSLIWRWKSAKGLEYQQDFAQFMQSAEQTAARDRGPKVINTTRTPSLPDTVWPGRIIVP